MKIVHAADLHLDSPLRGLVEYEGAPVSEVRAATRKVLRAIVDLCEVEEASLLLIAGDLYDGDFRDYSTALFFTEQMARLRGVGTQVVWLRGNHDAANRITRHLRAADHVHELSHDAAQTVTFEGLGVALHGQGYSEREVTDNLVPSYPKPLGGLLNIGLLHTALEGRAGHATYAPCSAVELAAKGYDYWALGHVHTREVISTEPWIVFPGNPQGRHIRETGPKGVTVLDVEQGKIRSVEERVLDQVRWSLVEVPADECDSLSEVLDATCRAMDRARDKADGRVLSCRVQLVGRTKAHGSLSLNRERVENELRAHAVSRGDIYVEQVRLATVGEISAHALAERRDALGDLFRAFEEVQSDKEAASALWSELLAPLSGLSSELIHSEEIDPEEVLLEARRLLEGRLLTSEGGDS